MIGHIIAGATGTGKTEFVKGKISKVPSKKSLFIYDINNEYKEFYNYELLSFEKFSSIAVRLNNAIIVLEEATIFLNNRSCNRDIIKLLVQKRHNGNYIFLNFHSLRAVPRYIFDLCNFITLFKTNDNYGFVQNQFKDDKINQLFSEIQKSENFHFNNTIKIN